MAKIVPNKDQKWGFPFFMPNAVSPASYLYQIALDHEVPPSMAFHDYLVDIASAHKKHEKGQVYVCYGSWIGKGVVWLIYPMMSAAVTENIMSNDSVIKTVAGAAESDRVLKGLQSTLISEEKRTLKFLPAASNLLKTEEETPFEYIYYITAKVNQQTKTPEYLTAVKKIIDAHNQHKQGLHWVTYEETGTDNIHIYIPMRKFGAMDQFPTLKEVLKVFNKGEAELIRQTFYSGIESHQNNLMTYVPSCDNSGCEFVE